jgi:hypothetical protein
MTLLTIEAFSLWQTLPVLIKRRLLKTGNKKKGTLTRSVVRRRRKTKEGRSGEERPQIRSQLIYGQLVSINRTELGELQLITGSELNTLKYA